MPRIVHMGGLGLSDDVVRIRDLGPGPRGKMSAQPQLDEEDWDDDEIGQMEDDDDPGFSTEGYNAPAAETSTRGRGIQEDILRSAMAEAGKIIEEAVLKAEEKKAELLAEVQFEAEQIRQNAAVEGRRQAMDEALDTVRQSAASIESAVASFEGDRAGFESEYEKQLKWLAMEISSKVLAKKVADDDAEMTEMVEKAVQSVKNESWIRVEVAQDMTNLIDRLTVLFDGNDAVSISPIPAQAGTVQIETPSGIIDASLRTQLANLRDYFAKVAN